MRIGTCYMCRRSNLFVNVSILDNTINGEYCADCWDSVKHDPVEHNLTATNSGPFNNDPGFDNVIRALEEDR